MAEPTRTDTYLVLAQIEDRNPPVSLGVWDTFSGGAVDSEETKYRPGGWVGEISLGGRRTYDNVTIGRYFDLLRDQGLYKWLMAIAGEVRMGVSWTALNLRGQVAGEPFYFGGTLKRVAHDDIDSEGTDAAKLELEMTVDRVS